MNGNRCCFVCAMVVLELRAFQMAGQKADQPLTALPYTPSLAVEFMDKSADPCTNFYQYACGNWNKLNPMPADEARWNVYSKVTDDNQRFLWGLLDKYSQAGRQRSGNEQKIGDFFHACMDTGAIEQAGVKPLEGALKEIADLRSVHEIAAYAAEQQQAGRGCKTKCVNSVFW